MTPLENLLRQTQDELFASLKKAFGSKAITSENQYIFVAGDAPVLLVAHLDTVHLEPVKTICRSEDGNILMSPEGIGGDDRCGVYALLKAYDTATVKPSLLFTCDEEIGGHGAIAFAEDIELMLYETTKNMLKMIVEIDRNGKNDAVYYDCDNKDFEAYITGKGFVTDIGSFSDISFIAPSIGVAAVNLSSGYYDAHTRHEHINIRELEDVIATVIDIIEESVSDTVPRFRYIEAESPWRGKYFRTGTKRDTKLPRHLQKKYDYLTSIYGKREVDEYLAMYPGDSTINSLYEEERRNETGYLREFPDADTPW